MLLQVKWQAWSVTCGAIAACAAACAALQRTRPEGPVATTARFAAWQVLTDSALFDASFAPFMWSVLLYEECADVESAVKNGQTWSVVVKCADALSERTYGSDELRDLGAKLERELAIHRVHLTQVLAFRGFLLSRMKHGSYPVGTQAARWMHGIVREEVLGVSRSADGVYVILVRDREHRVWLP
jgi:hypothetical protein